MIASGSLFLPGLVEVLQVRGSVGRERGSAGVSGRKTAASGDGGKPGLPAAGREAAVNADKENRMMYNPAVRCIFTSCVNRDGSKRSMGGANQDWMRFAASYQSRACGCICAGGVRAYARTGTAPSYQSGAQASRSHSSSWRVRYFFRLRKTWR